MGHEHTPAPSDSARFAQERQTLLWGETDTSPKNPSELNLKDLFPELICTSEIMRKLLLNVYKIARSHSAVLILGESGTGKELVASAIHRLSWRAHQGFVAINCSAIPENLLEAELFGYEKGAFTGADRKRIGHFAAANNGSVFLDEIGDMPLRLQAKLLRVLQEKKFTPLGSREPTHADIRIIAATNVDLEKAVKDQGFRLDLYYRLNVLPIMIPPLRERREDISLLLDHFAELCNRNYPHHEPGWFDAEAKALLCQYDWPGNIRQLQNLVERLVIISGGGRLGVETLPEEFKVGLGKIFLPPRQENTSSKSHSWAGLQAVASPSSAKPDGKPSELPLMALPEQGFNLSRYMEELENHFISQALHLTKNNKNQAAKLLGLNRTTLVERLKKRKLPASL